MKRYIKSYDIELGKIRLEVEPYNISYWDNEAIPPAAVTRIRGTRCLYNNLLHRNDGKPAITHTDGYKEWFVYGKMHREDGPALIRSDGTKEFWINGDKFTEEQWKEIVNA